MHVSRRRFLRTSGGIAASTWLIGTSRLAASASAPAARVPIGFQLYSVRGEFAKDVPGTLKALADMGYAGVEFWGYNGTPNIFQNYSARQLRKLLDQYGLKCCGMHLSLAALSPDKFAHTVAVNKTLGNPYLNVAAASREMESVDSIKKFAARLSQLSAKAKALRMHVGYHCHPFDMKRFGDKSGWELLFSQTSPDVLMQLDTGNCAGGGGDPLAILKEFPGRTATIHIKEYGEAKWVPNQPTWTEIFRLCETSHHTQWYIVEQGGAGGLGFDIPRECLQKLKKMGK